MIWPSIRFDISFQNFKKPLDIFSGKKMFRRIFSYKFGCRKKTLNDFLAASSSLKKTNTGRPAIKTYTWTLSFKTQDFYKNSNTPFLVNENFCLCKYVHRIIFLLLIVSSISCNFNSRAVCFQLFMNIACRSTQNAARIKRFLRLHIVIKPLIKNRLNKFFITLKRNSFKISSQIWRLSKVRTGWPYRWFWKFFERFR